MQADNAMYQAKEDMSTNIAFFTDSVRQVLVDQMNVLEAVNEALERDQFIMCYQPQYNHERELIGLEALIRWQHPRMGLLSPDKFIPLAETHHRINAIGTWVLDAVFKQVQQWREAGLTLPKVAINISSIQLLDAGFVTVVEDLAEQYGIYPKQVVFEITESIGIEHFVLVQGVLEDLKVQGYRFSLDDFGTGYASMTNFKRLPFSQVKVDQSFIADIEKDGDSLAIVEVVLALARSLHLEVIAEGVETRGQFDILDRLECTGYQGYLFSKPLGVQAITSWLRSRIE
jgi:EAL domain-containing protein (putative c-di-GMP-specific phosphodiesterase class I)